MHVVTLYIYLTGEGEKIKVSMYDWYLSPIPRGTLGTTLMIQVRILPANLLLSVISNQVEDDGGNDEEDDNHGSNGEDRGGDNVGNYGQRPSL